MEHPHGHGHPGAQHGHPGQHQGRPGQNTADRYKDRKTTYTNHLVYRRTEQWFQLPDSRRKAAADELQAVIDQYQDRLTVRGIYSTVGFRNDSDVIFWIISNDVDTLQQFAVDVRRTAFGQGTSLQWAFPGLTRPPEFDGDHITAFQKGIPPRKYICLYPFVRTPEWYLLPREERGKMLREHGMKGREFPEVLTNNVQAFGIGDYEWILAFECDEYQAFVDLVRHLRATQARLYTKEDTPFIIGTRKPLRDVMRDFAPESIE